MQDDRLKSISDDEYRYEYFRLYGLYKLNQIDSTTLVIKVNSELLSLRLYKTIIKLLRSLDMVTLIKHNNVFHVSILFPLADNSVATGFLSRLLKNISNLNENQFEYMIFGFKQIDLYDEYISTDHE